MVGWARVFSWLFASRSITQKDVAAGWAGLYCGAVGCRLLHRMAVGHGDGGAVGQLVLDTLRGADERGCLGHEQREQQHRNGCGENASRD